MAKGTKNTDILYRSEKFELFWNRRPVCAPTAEELALLTITSENLRTVWNEAWRARMDAYENFFKPIYEKIGTAKKLQDEALVKGLYGELRDAFKQHGVSLYDQINALTPRRKADPAFASIPRNWQEETLDCLDASFKSFFALRKNGDADAKQPFARETPGFFCKIPGRYGFSFDGENITISFAGLGQRIVCQVPDHQRERFGNSLRLKKFEIYRDERDLSKPGSFWISVAYEIPKPPEKPVTPDNTVYLALGASYLGMVCPKGEFYFRLPRPDFHWKPLVDQVQERLKNVTKGSRKWKKRISARWRMFDILGKQQKQGQYELIQEELLSQGVHFVITDLVVRSKTGALADASKPERGGAPTGANWSAQNTGWIANLVAKLAEKAKEHGGIVVKREPSQLSPQERKMHPGERKIIIARRMREAFLADQQ